MRSFCRKTCVHKIPRFRGGGGILGLGGGVGECRFYFYGRADFSELVSPDFLPPARCNFSQRPFQRKTLSKWPFSLSRVGKNRILQGVENRGSLISAPLPLREYHPNRECCAVVNLLGVVNLLSHSDLLSRRTVCRHHFPENCRHLSRQRGVHGVVNLGGVVKTLRRSNSLSRSVFSTAGPFRNRNDGRRV